MKNSDISLSFLEITPKKFDVAFYWKRLDLIRDIDKENYYIKNLNLTSNSEKSEKIAISFNPVEEFEKKVVHCDFNIEISKQFLLQRLRKQFDSSEIFPTIKDKHNRIYLILCEHNEGTETIWLEPYYISVNQTYGLLLDFKFFVDHEYKRSLNTTLDKRILQLSGTLDKSLNILLQGLGRELLNL